MKFQVSTLLAGLMLANAVSAATLVNLQNQPASYLQQYGMQQQKLAASNQSQLKQVRADIDFNHTAHVRMQQTFGGLPVWGATSVIHIPKANTKNMLGSINNLSTANGIVYENIAKDLTNTPNDALSDIQKAKALQAAKSLYATKAKLTAVNSKKETIKTVIFVDDNQQAHYAYLTSFLVDDGITGAHIPTTIMDAYSLKVYRSWDQVMTDDKPELVMGGGIGGNEKVGQTIYDGDTDHAPALSMHSEKFSWEMIPGQAITITLCSLENNLIEVQDVAYGSEVVSGTCNIYNGKHNNVLWLANEHNGTRWMADEANGAYSPSLDAYYAANIVSNLYQSWYGIPALTLDDGKTPMKLVMRVHYGRHFDNAFWDGQQMTFGDGGNMFYPLTSLGVTAHEISHGFTQQHSDIDGSQPQMAALHEAFSDMASIAAEYFTKGKITTWDIGRDITKGEGALRYLDNPKKDGRSVDNMKDFDETEAHLGAGIFNKAFYLIATSKGWDPHMAFNVMVKANMNYWTSSMKTFAEAACGVVSATKDYNYNVADVRVAFSQVGLDTSNC